MQNNLVDDAPSLSALSGHLTTSCVSLKDYDGHEDLLARMPREMAAKHRAMPLGLMNDRGENRLILAMVDPTDFAAIEAASQALGADVEPVVVGPNDFADALDRCYGPDPLAASAIPMGGSKELPPPPVGPPDEAVDASDEAEEGDDEEALEGLLTGESSQVDPDDEIIETGDALPSWDGYDTAAHQYVSRLDGPLPDEAPEPVPEPKAKAKTEAKAEAQSVADRPPIERTAHEESKSNTVLRKPSRQRSNVFRDFMRESSVVILRPPVAKAGLPATLQGIDSDDLVRATVALLIERGIFTEDDLGAQLAELSDD